MGMQGMGMVYTSCVIQGLEPTPAVLAIMLLVPFSVYNMNRKTDEEEDSVNHPGRYQFTKRFEKPLEYGALVTYALAVLIAVPYGVAAVLVTLVPLLAGVLYSMPILPKALGYRRLKEIPVMKNLVVASSWSVILVLLPCLASGTPVTIQSYLCFAFFFSYVFIASAMPDMRDREGDALTGCPDHPGDHRSREDQESARRDERLHGPHGDRRRYRGDVPLPDHRPLCRDALLHPVLHHLVRSDRPARPDLRHSSGRRVRDHRRCDRSGPGADHPSCSNRRDESSSDR